MREKSKAIAALLADDERLRDERRTRMNLRDRMVSSHISSSPYASGSGAVSERRVSYQPSSAVDEQYQLERAIEESKRTAEQEKKIRTGFHVSRYYTIRFPLSFSIFYQKHYFYHTYSIY